MFAIRAGLSKRGARLEALLQGITQWRIQKFLMEHQVIMIEIVEVLDLIPVSPLQQRLQRITPYNTQ